jgi:hypothetical protein
VAFVGVVATGLAGCGSDESISTGVGRLSIAARAPANADHEEEAVPGLSTAVVTISRAEILLVTADAESAEDEDLQPAEDSDEDEGEWIVLRDTPVTVDLAALDGDMTPILGNATLPNGTYAELRLVFDGGYIVVDSGGESLVFATDGYDVPADLGEAGLLRMPSMAESGLKLKLPEGSVVAGDQHVLVLDFDLAESLGHAADGDTWVMHPVIHVGGWLLTGTLEVSVTPAEGLQMPDGVSLAMFDAGIADSSGQSVAQIGLEDPDQDGTFGATASFLDPRGGPYQVRIFGPDSVTFDTDPSFQWVDVPSGSIAQADFVLTAIASN